MTTHLDPIVSEFATQEDADLYDTWFRAKVEKSLQAADDPASPRYTSDEVARRLSAVIMAASSEHAERHLA